MHVSNVPVVAVGRFASALCVKDLLVLIPTALLKTQTDSKAMLLPKPVTPCTETTASMHTDRYDKCACAKVDMPHRRPIVI